MEFRLTEENARKIITGLLQENERLYRNHVRWLGRLHRVIAPLKDSSALDNEDILEIIHEIAIVYEGLAHEYNDKDLPEQGAVESGVAEAIRREIDRRLIPF